MLGILLTYCVWHLFEQQHISLQSTGYLPFSVFLCVISFHVGNLCFLLQAKTGNCLPCDFLSLKGGEGWWLREWSVEMGRLGFYGGSSPYYPFVHGRVSSIFYGHVSVHAQQSN